MLIRNLKKYWMNRMLCPLESKHRRHFKNQSLCGDKHCWQESNLIDFETSPDGQGKGCQWQPFEQAKNDILYMLIRNLKKYRMNRMLCPLESKHRRHLKNQSLCGDKHCWQESNMRHFIAPWWARKKLPMATIWTSKKNLLYMLIRNLKKYRMNRMLCPLESKHRRHLKNQSLCGDKHCWQESNMRHFIAPWLRTCQIIFRPRGIKHGCPINSWSQRSTDDNVTPVHF